MNPAALPESLAAKIAVDPAGCWIWTAGRKPSGYGQVSFGGLKGRHAHRLIYEMLVGPVPDGLEIDHLCRVRACVNPAHMEPVTHRENILRGKAPAAVNAAKTHCKHGHAFTPENTYIRPDNGGRMCRRCTSLRVTALKSTRRAAARARLQP